MKLLFISLIAILSLPLTWSGNFDEAKAEALKAHKLILVNFSGSDWCGPCIRLRKEILESDEFEKFAPDNLVLVRADFPRQKKNQLSKQQTKMNEKLADQYNAAGKFPYTVLLGANGKVLRSWDGFPNESAEKFINEIKRFANASK